MAIEKDGLAADIVERSDDWRVHRDVENEKRWDEYYRIWRGVWAPEDKSKESERSRVIMPNTQQAVESAIAEIEEAFFGREVWLDAGDPQLTDSLIALLRGFQSAFTEAFLMSALYGTGIMKVTVGGTASKPMIGLVAIHPKDFIIDPSAASIDESYGVTHELSVPRHIVERRMKDGFYKQMHLEGSDKPVRLETGEQQPRNTDYISLREWHGLIPYQYLEKNQKTDQLKNSRIGEDGLVEGIATIANDEYVLRAEANPYDRGFAAFSYEKVPKRFWGRGIVEKAYWSQKSLDTEMRARIDALAYSVNPMMAINSSLIPRGERFSVRPGRNIFLAGTVRENIMPVTFPSPDPQTYQQSSELQRMIELATGQIQTANPIGDLSRTGSGVASMFLGATIRRTKRTLKNIERDLIEPILIKLTSRLNDLDPESWPAMPTPPKVISGLGIMAREYEISQLTQLISTMPDGPPKLAMIKLIIDQSSFVEKQFVVEMVDRMIQDLMNPQEEPMRPQDEIQLYALQLQEKIATAQAQTEQAKLAQEEASSVRAHERDIVRLSLEQERIESEKVKREADSILAIAKAEAEELGSQLERYRAVIESIAFAQASRVERRTEEPAEVVD